MIFTGIRKTVLLLLLTVNILRLLRLYPQMLHLFLKPRGPGMVTCISYYLGMAMKMQVATMPQRVFESSG